MTISVNQINVAANDTFSSHINITNIIANALNTSIVTTNSNTTVGNSSISGTFVSSQLITTTLNGGNTSQLANLTISTNTQFISNVSFSAAATFSNRVTLGSNVTLNLGNTSNRVLAISPASSNLIIATRINFNDHSDITITNPLSGDSLSYSNTSNSWINRPGFFPNTVGATNNSILRYNTANSTWYQSNTLIVYYANGTQAYP